jgi:hypothetical protein
VIRRLLPDAQEACDRGAHAPARSRGPRGQASRRQSRDKEGKPLGDPGSISYSAAIESAATPDTSPELSDFAARVQREASRRGFTEARRQAMLGDGATWIWNTGSELYPQATQILDRFHAKEHLGDMGKVIYGDSPEAKAWIDARFEELDEGHLKSLVHVLRSHIGQHEKARECIQYIWNNRRRMQYPEFEKQSFCASTGVVESGCKVVVGTRLKRAGMHWTVKGTNAVIALRCSKLSGRFRRPKYFLEFEVLDMKSGMGRIVQTVQRHVQSAARHPDRKESFHVDLDDAALCNADPQERMEQQLNPWTNFVITGSTTTRRSIAGVKFR